MKKLLYLFLISLGVSSCTFLSPHKRSIEQGNVFTDQEVQSLRVGMTEIEVKRMMGEPVMKNIFTHGVVVYVYTIQPGGEERKEKKVTCTFHQGRLSNISN